jgi:16S rRNA (uracil1498-N3)-methyltransferase
MDRGGGAARLIVPRLPTAGETVRISGDESRHARARRLATGDPVVLIDGSGREARGRLGVSDKDGLDVVVEAVGDGRGEPASEVVLYAAAVRLSLVSWIVEKATELGVTRVIPVTAARVQADRAAATRSWLGRLERVAREAAKQCGRARWPSISAPVALPEALEASCRSRVLLDSRGQAFPLRLPGSVALLVGPEGGFTEEEIESARGAGWTCARLPFPELTLRTESAAIAAVTLARAAMIETS